MQRRIYGVETEYGIIFTPEGREELPVEQAIRFLFEKLVKTGQSPDLFLENGARLYQDRGFHPEYATPECTSPSQLIIYDRAGERILEDLQIYAEARIREAQKHFKHVSRYCGCLAGCRIFAGSGRTAK